MASPSKSGRKEPPTKIARIRAMQKAGFHDVMRRRGWIGEQEAGRLSFSQSRLRDAADVQSLVKRLHHFVLPAAWRQKSGQLIGAFGKARRLCQCSSARHHSFRPIVAARLSGRFVQPGLWGHWSLPAWAATQYSSAPDRARAAQSRLQKMQILGEVGVELTVRDAPRPALMS